MAKTTKSPQQGSSPGPEGGMPPLPVPVHCCGEGCDATTTFVLMGDGVGYDGGLFEDPGWTIGTGEDFEDSGGSFICRKCFEKESKEGHITRD
jgi:hypothetical protein